MEKTDLGSWLLGDEMGLGKTLAALSRLVESARANMYGQDAETPLEFYFLFIYIDFPLVSCFFNSHIISLPL